MFGYKLVKVEKEATEGTEKKEEKKSFAFKGAAKTVGKVLGTGLLVGGAFLVGKGGLSKKEEPEAEVETETGTEQEDTPTEE